MSLIYDGFLQTQVAEQIFTVAKDYGHAIEISSWPPNWSEWMEENLNDYYIREGDYMNNSNIRKTKCYCLVSRGNGFNEPAFLFLKTQEEKDAIVRDFPDIIVNESPFRTMIDK